MSVVPIESGLMGATSGGGRHPRMLLRGEGLIAVPGLALAVILLSAVAVVGFWMRGNQRLAARAGKQSQVKVIAGVMAGAAESVVEAGDLAGVRRMVADAGRARDLSVCRITLPSGAILADADAKKINVKQLPARWEGTVNPVAALAADANEGVVASCEVVKIAGRGVALLEVAAPVPANGNAAWTTLLGVGASGVIGLVGLLMVYRKLRAKVIPLGLIRDGLLALAAGETARDALALSPTMGAEAVAWNKLLAEAQGLRNETVAEQAKEALGGPRQSRSDLEHGCDALSVGLVILDDRGRVRHANGAAATLLQRQKDKMIGAAAAELIDDEAARKVIAAAVSGSGTAAAGSVQRKTVEFERNGGVLRVQVRPLRREDHPGAVITIEDVTQQRVAEASRHSFVAHTTHELRTPLTNIRLYLETLLDESGSADDPATRSKCLNVVNLEVRRLERMVGEMLSVSEIEAGSLKLKTGDVRLDKMFDELQADYAAAAGEKKLAMKFELPPKWPVIQGDREKLAAALHNLIGNAVKYTPAGGKVTVAVTVEEKRLIVMVADSGIGISEEEQALVFERFYRAKDPRVEKVTGTGLGLTLAREVARLHGGDVTLKSAVDQGSTFTLVIPVTAQAA